MLGYGSGGTVVLEGALDGRPVAVKRLLARFAELARTEINALIHTDDHPNVVRVPENTIPKRQSLHVWNRVVPCRCWVSAWLALLRQQVFLHGARRAVRVPRP